MDGSTLDSASISICTTLTSDKSKTKIKGEWLLRLRPTSCLIVCSCWCCYYYISSIFLLFSLSLSSQLTFCLASVPIAPSPATILNPPTPPFKTTEEAVGLDHHVDQGLKLLIALSVSAFFLIVLLLIVMAFLTKFLRFKQRRKSSEQVVGVQMQNSKDDDDDDDDGSAKKFTWQEIERLTNNFSQVVGSGGFSNVYLAHLPGSASTLGAVKIHCGSDRLNRVFKQELDILLRLRHDNIVRFLGYCDDREEGALIFEYVPNGSLQEKLHGANYTERQSVFPWRSRMAIAFQLAQAIEYLHDKCALQIVHGDIKASNILLDEHLNCKLCDFGSAKMGFSSMVLPSSSPSSSPSLKNKQLMIGSPGYTDPLYLRTGIASKKNDVYSYGVIILELVMGIEAFCPERGQLLTSIAGPMLRDISECETTKVAEMVDPQLGGDIDMEEARAMLSISALCLGLSPSLRPSANQILQTMKDKISSISFLSSPHIDSKSTTT